MNRILLNGVIIPIVAMASCFTAYSAYSAIQKKWEDKKLEAIVLAMPKEQREAIANDAWCRQMKNRRVDWNDPHAVDDLERFYRKCKAYYR